MPDYVCRKCGRHTSEVFEVGVTNGAKSLYCKVCAHRESVQPCSVCGQLIDTSVVGVAGGGFLICPQCNQLGYGVCVDCGVLCAARNQRGRCAGCAARRGEEPPIPREETTYQSYHYRPRRLIFKKLDEDNVETDPYLGFELEVDRRGRTSSSMLSPERVVPMVAEHAVDWCTRDGSLCYGFEMISHPMTLKAHKATDWPQRLMTISDQGFKSYDCENCGMHVHVNRTFLEHDQWIALDNWVSENSKFVIAIARRHSTGYARFHSDMSSRDVDFAQSGRNRYVAVNFCNPATIEFRVFRGTLVPRTLFKNLEFVDALVRFFKFERNHALSDFLKFIDQQPARYAELKRFIEERKVLEKIKKG